MNQKLLIFVMIGFLLIPLSNAYSTKISCSDNIDVNEYPICNYVDEWNESEEFNEKVLAEMTKRVNEINDEPELAYQVYEQSVDLVNQLYPGLQEKGEETKDRIYEMIRNS